MKTCSKIILISLIMLIPLCGCSSKEDKKAAHIQKGSDYFEAKQYKKAEIEFKNALQIDGTDIQTLMKLGNTFMKLGQVKEAFSVFSSVEKKDPDNIEALGTLAKFYFLDKKLAETQMRIDKILEKDPSNIGALFLKGRVLARRNQVDEARAIFEKILEIKDDHVGSLHAIAGIKAKEQKFDEAEALLQKAVASAEDTTQTRIVLAQFYIARKQLDKAEEQLNLSAAEHPENAGHQILLGNFYLKTRNMEKAEAAYKKAVEIQPDKNRPLVILAGFYNLTGKKEQALELYRKACAIDPDDMNTRMVLARFLYRDEKKDEAEKELKEIMNKRPGLASARRLKSEILISQKEYQPALQLLSALEKDEPNSHRVQYFKGLCYIGLGDPNQAAASVYKAVELKPDYIQAKMLLSEIYFRQHSYELTVEQTTGALRLNPNLYRALLIRANAYMALKKFQDAENDYRYMIKLNPDNPTGYYRIAYLKSGMRQFDQAEPLLEKAYSLNNKLLDVFNLRVRNALVQNSFEKAHNLCTQQMETFKDNDKLLAVIHNTRAKIYLVEKNMDNAESEFKKAIDISPDYLAPYNELAKIYLARKNIELAKKQYKTIISKNKKSASAHMLLAVLYEVEKNFDTAEEHYRKALDINPNYAAAANNLSYHLAARTDKLDEALALARKAKTLYPEDPSIMDTLGFAYYKKGLYGNAVVQFLDCLEKIPDNPVVRYHLGLAYYGKGEKALAGKELANALELKDNFSGAEHARTLLKEINKG
ncbi:cytochrome c biogenesis factor [Desulfobacter hydrogenophilus]|uniref:Cytochrome c biogenesis factor n=1 Tax=Desulfobacter hydrogenophilus TaxID=2291 RepID=A0A328FDQ5_9BACT|nr:tetratricopeptide repeat protein [Desulfobacter hydrogenophilus]NDY73816.1 tetratricopeptide repeat protein [Desulfobacter hydrogenophilus]QBH13702.1 tetratricopeptide repeat protein [Desulfobacter hydrogenophilus]RAM01890.1 cytochrome c biogenesis factor [Desulfobacter hydrogenophilus]